MRFGVFSPFQTWQNAQGPPVNPPTGWYESRDSFNIQPSGSDHLRRRCNVNFHLGKNTVTRYVVTLDMNVLFFVQVTLTEFHHSLAEEARVYRCDHASIREHPISGQKVFCASPGWVVVCTAQQQMISEYLKEGGQTTRAADHCGKPYLSMKRRFTHVDPVIIMSRINPPLLFFHDKPGPTLAWEGQSIFPITGFIRYGGHPGRITQII